MTIATSNCNVLQFTDFYHTLVDYLTQLIHLYEQFHE